MSQDLIKTDEYRSLIVELKSRIQAAQIKAAITTVNSQLIELYWDIGRQIAEKQHNPPHAQPTFETLAG